MAGTFGISVHAGEQRSCLRTLTSHKLSALTNDTARGK